MFEIGWSELVVIGIVALIAIGPKELPGALRTLGQWMGKIRRMASEFQDQFKDAMREAELADLKKEVDDMAAKASSYSPFDPIAEAGRDIEKSLGELPPLDAPSTNATPTPQTDAATGSTAAANVEAAPAPVASEMTALPEPRPADTPAEAGATPPKPSAGAREPA